ncbi:MULTISPECIES: hypothetical protein [Nocardia]|uniref:hypothetical protein n=1 Tax=Nocardia TaxID=1817 RepID=UPI0012D7AE8F|nr:MULTISPECIES: hypothetical protein [Nocardia]MBF6278637.1 hypothetical protein [Nocardia nova]
MTLVDESEKKLQASFQPPIQPNFVAVQTALGESGTDRSTNAIRAVDTEQCGEFGERACLDSNNPGGGRDVHGVE